MTMMNIFYFVFFSSVVFIYGIGIERTSILCLKRRSIILKMIKMLICVTSTTSLTYLISSKILVPQELGELFPFIAILIFLSISVFVESIVRITFHVSAAEFAVAFLFVLVGLSESTSLGESVFISLLCVLSFFAAIPFLYAINKRVNYNERKRHFENFAFFLVSFAVIIIILLSWNTSYLQTL